jgi:hypothetical protein
MIALPDFRSGAAWVALGPLVVGATFLWTGAIKAFAPHVFREHLARLGWIPLGSVSYLVPAAAGLETGLGMMLILGLAPQLVLPLTAVLLVVLTAVSWWGVKSGRTTDCGCYGGYVAPSIAQSAMLNAAFIALVILAWQTGAAPSATPEWKIVVIIACTAVFAALGAAAQQFLLKNGRKMIETSPLKVGRHWSRRWGIGLPEDGGEMMMSYLGPDCPYCKRWVRVLNAMDQAPGLPRVTGIVAVSAEKRDAFIESSGIRFPVVTIPVTLMSRLVWGVPTTVLVSSGRIEDLWGGHMPPEFFNRFKEAFFPEAVAGEGEPVRTTT